MAAMWSCFFILFCWIMHARNLTMLYTSRARIGKTHTPCWRGTYFNERRSHRTPDWHALRRHVEERACGSTTRVALVVTASSTYAYALFQFVEDCFRAAMQKPACKKSSLAISYQRIPNLIWKIGYSVVIHGSLYQCSYGGVLGPRHIEQIIPIPLLVLRSYSG